MSLSTIGLEYNGSTNPGTVSNCQLYDGTPSLTTGSNVVNPTASASGTSFTFDTPLSIAKGSAKTISLKCDTAGNATAGNVFSWGYDTNSDRVSPTGKTSGQSIDETVTDNMGQLMTVAASGTYTVADDSTPGYLIVSSGTAGITLLKLKFSATTEEINLQRVGFDLGQSAATNTPNDLVG